MEAIVTTNKQSKPTFSEPPPNPLGKNASRDIHAGRWSCARGYAYGQQDQYMGSWVDRTAHSPFREDLTLPTPPKDLK
jgi:hypothetical protein